MEGLIKGLAYVALGGRRHDDENTKEEENTVEQQSRSSWAEVSVVFSNVCFFKIVFELFFNDRLCVVGCVWW